MSRTKRKILVVDDSDLTRAILAELFSQDYQVLEAEDGVIAIDRISENQRELAAIFLDIVMPRMDGFGVLEYLNKTAVINRIPTFLITSNTSTDITLKGYGMGVVDVINKPINPVVVKKRVGNIIELYQQRQNLENLVNEQVRILNRQKRADSPGRKPRSFPPDPPEAGGQETKTVTVTERTLNLLNLEREKYHLLSKISDEIIFDYDMVQDTLEFSEKFVEVFGQEGSILRAREFLRKNDLLFKGDLQRIKEKARQVDPDHPVFRLEVQLRAGEDQFIWYEIYANALWDAKKPDHCVGFLGKITNINTLKMETMYWQQFAMHDGLTGLFNKEALKSQVKKLLETAPGETFALLFLDIDNYKQINDTFGHEIGDMVLKQFAVILQENVRRSTDIVARMGGDEFVVVLRGIEDGRVLSEKARQICNLCQKAKINYIKRSVGVSMGIAVYPKDGGDYATLLRKADKALYYSKNRGKGQYNFYNADLLEEDGGPE